MLIREQTINEIIWDEYSSYTLYEEDFGSEQVKRFLDKVGISGLKHKLKCFISQYNYQKNIESIGDYKDGYKMHLCLQNWEIRIKNIKKLLSYKLNNA